MSYRAALVAWLVVLVGSTACRPPPGPVREEPLLDDLHAPDVLTEGQRLELPPVPGGNRFLSGWRVEHRPAGLRLHPLAGGSRLEIVTLAARPRRLVLITEIAAVPAEATVAVRAAGREVGPVPLTRALAIPLPEDLPRGRSAIDLGFPAGVGVAVVEAAVEEALPAGVVELGAGEIAQSGFSAVDFVRPVPGGSTLVGRFVPPPDAGPDERFAVVVEREDGGPRVGFEWRGGFRGRLFGTRPIAVPLGPGSGVVRIRLLATGEGAVGRWQGLRLRLPEPPPSEPPAAPPEPPQVVVLYVLDALRADHLGHLGGPAGATPALDRLASEGLTFTRHLSVAPNTLPATKSLFTGQAYLTRGGWKLPPEGSETLAELFSQAGYRTGLFSGNVYVSPAYGTARGFDHYATDVEYRETSAAAGYNDHAERVHRSVRRWLDGLASGDRAFLYLHTIHPHNPYDPPEPFRSRFTAGIDSTIDGSTRTLRRVHRGRLAVDGEDRRRIRGLYAGGLAYNDAEIASFLDAVRRRYPPGEVLVVVTADHGEELFDHGGALHGYTLYEEQLRIPLIFWWPHRLRPGRVEAATDTLDLHETLRSLVGAPPSHQGHGRALWELLLRPGVGGAGKEVRFAAASSVRGGIFMARSARYKLIFAPRTGRRWGMGGGFGRSWDAEYLFDLVRDPGERQNLAGAEIPEAAWLRSRLRAWIDWGKAVETGVEVTDLDAETRARLEALGYVE